MNLNGGYAMIAQDATQKDLEIAYKTKRPVLLYDAEHRAHWAQINEKVIETVDEETQETIITYEYSYQLLNAIEALVDDSGNPRFVEGEGVPLSQEGVTISYCKWSLSGTHLMLVCAGTIANTTVIANNAAIGTYNLPDYISNKIYPVWANARLERKTIQLLANDWTSQNVDLTLTLDTNKLSINLTSGNLTLTANRAFRIQFDLLIDNE